MNKGELERISRLHLCKYKEFVRLGLKEQAEKEKEEYERMCKKIRGEK